MAGMKIPAPVAPLEEDEDDDDEDIKEEEEEEEVDEEEEDAHDEDEEHDGDDATIPAGSNFPPRLLDHLWNMGCSDAEEVDQARGPDLIQHDPADPLKDLLDVEQFTGLNDDPNALQAVNRNREENPELSMPQNSYAEDI